MDFVLVRYGEIGLKSKWVKREFEGWLISNISICLNRNKIRIDRISCHGSRIYVYCDKIGKALKVLKNVFGIVSISPVYSIEPELDSIKKFALKLYKLSGEKSFRITSKRRDKSFPMNSQQIVEYIGGYIVEKERAPVNLKKPGVEISIEIEKSRAMLFVKKIKCFGGMPIGSQGRCMCLVSGGINSSLAAWKMMRRGCQTTLVYVDAGKYGIKGSRQRVEKIANYLAKNFYSHKEPLKLVILNFEPVYNLLKTEVTNVGIFAKKLMLDAVELLCNEFGAKSVVTGDNIRSMASGLFREKKFVYLYPIVGLSKTEVEKDVKEIGLDKFVVHNKKPAKKRAKTESIVLGKYTQLMNGVIKTKKMIELK